LTAKEETSCENESSALVVIPSEHTLVGSLVHHRPVCIVDISVKNRGPVLFKMLRLLGKRLLFSAEHRGLVHVVPKTVNLRCANELVIGVKRLPVLSRILVEIVDPHRSSRPAVTLELAAKAVVYENLGCIVFKGGSIFVNKISACNFDMWVGDCNQFPLVVENLGVHCC